MTKTTKGTGNPGATKKRGRPKGSVNKNTTSKKVDPRKKEFQDAISKARKTGGRSRAVSYKKDVAPYLEEIKTLVEEGLNNKEIIKIIGCSEPVFYKWLKEYDDFYKVFHSESIHDRLEDGLMNSLFKRATEGVEVVETEENIVGGKVVSETKRTKRIVSDKAADLYMKHVLGARTGDSEININFVNDGKTVSIDFASNDDDGDFEGSR